MVQAIHYSAKKSANGEDFLLKVGLQLPDDLDDRNNKDKFRCHFTNRGNDPSRGP